MPRLIENASRVTAAGAPPKTIDEYVGRVNSGDGALSVALDRAGLAGSSGSACGSGAAQASHVLEAAGVVGTPLRLSLGWTTTDAEVDRAIDVLTDTIPTVRATTPAWL